MNKLMRRSERSDAQSKFIQERIALVEKHFGNIHIALKGYAKKMNSVRSKGDVLSETITNYCEKECINKSAKEKLGNAADLILAVEDYRNAQVNRINMKIVEAFSMYGSLCKIAREDLKMAFSAQKKEINQKKSLKKLMERSPDNRHHIMLAESELMKASVDASRTGQILEERMDAFERKKLQDLKEVFGEFLRIELSFHCKAVELLTEAYKEVCAIDVDSDMEEFMTGYKEAENAKKMQLSLGGIFGSTSLFGSSPSLGSRFKWGSLRSSKSSLSESKESLEQSTGKKGAALSRASVSNYEEDDSEEEEEESEEEVEDEVEEEESEKEDEEEEEEEIMKEKERVKEEKERKSDKPVPGYGKGKKLLKGGGAKGNSRR